MTAQTQPAALPPPGLPGLDPRWSRLVPVTDSDGVRRTWHVLDTGVADAELTLLCVHGNPTWSYLWRSLLAAAPPTIRVIAVDQLDMGFSERTGTVRRLAQRVADLSTLTEALELSGPVVTVAHDWGGPVSLGWALDHQADLVGVVLTNTAVHQPEGAAAPSLIRLARTAGIRDWVCVRTANFIRGATAMTSKPLNPAVKDAYLAPYETKQRRKAVGEFVADIPLEPTHPSASSLDDIAERLRKLDVPALLVWGPKDPVFSERYLRDLMDRLPHAAVHRVEGASHLVPEEPAATAAILNWSTRLLSPQAGDSMPSAVPDDAAPRADDVPRRPLWGALDERGDDPAVAIVDQASGRSASFAALAARARDIAAGLASVGVRPGDRVGLLIPPGVDLAAAVYGCWRLGAVVVAVDAGLGPAGIGRALKSADPSVLIGIPRALVAAATLRWPGRRILVGPVNAATRSLLGSPTSLDEVAQTGRGLPTPLGPRDTDDAIVVFTSGATGPAKGVVYRHQQLQAQRDALISTFDITRADRMVAGFGPFAMYGPALGVASAIPDVSPIRPGRLSASALADAALAVDATMVFASPAALQNVAATAKGLQPEQQQALDRVRLLMSFGAPVPVRTLSECSRLMPAAQAHTPYGMTEVLPVATAELAQIQAAGTGNGVYVGRPVPGVEVALAALDEFGSPSGELTDEPEVSGEICVRAAHTKDRYDALWLTEESSTVPGGWHRTGDVGHLGADGALWVEGRVAHVVSTADGPVTPVRLEQRIEELAEVAAAAVVGVGPVGTQVLVAVVVPTAARPRIGVADSQLTAAVRSKAADAAAVLVVPRLPVDRRHNSKVDRLVLADWAGDVLAGGSPRGARRW